MEVGSRASPELIYSVEDSIAEPVESTDDMDKYNGCTQEVSQNDYIPEVGKEFESEEDAEKFYNDYARRIGFSIRRSKVHRKFSVIVDRIFCCSREGFRKKDKRDKDVKKHSLETRVGCEAQMRVMMNSNGRYEVMHFEPVHNHELVVPTMVHILRSHRRLTVSQDAKVDIPDSSMVAPSAIMGFVGTGGHEVSIVEPVESTHDTDKYNGCRQEVSQTDYVPKIGKEFESEEDAEKFYNEYARRTGFSMRKSKIHRRFGVVVDRIFCCSREGFRQKDKRDKDVKKHRLETRVGCKAEMRVMVNSIGKYEITRFEPIHNHELVLPAVVHMLRSHRHFTTQDAKVDTTHSSGVAPSTIMGLVGKQAGGQKSLGFTVMDCNNYLHFKWNTSMKKGDAKGLLEYFQTKKSEDPSFFYALQLDEDEMISNIFWADVRMMSEYNYFGDVVCFDTTYKTNTEDRPFGLFIGVNHHKQIVIFGAVLLYDETTHAFKWLFKTFIKAMSGKSPKTILTDQNHAMISAIRSVLPDTHHRLCIWHIYQTATKRVHDVFQCNKKISEDLQRCLYEYEDDKEFKEEWNNMIEKYHLQGNKWLDDLFKEREKWALAYGRNTFCAYMSATQRSESMNNVLKMFLNTTKDMLQFLRHFDGVVAEQRYEELKADCKMSQSAPVSAGSIMILDHAKSVYTQSIFEIFQGEVLQTLNCDARVCGEVCTTTEYKVSNGRSTRHHEHTVSFDSSNAIVSCSCKKFDFTGILCSHALWVFHIKGIRKIPDHYILNRWRKDAKSGGIANCHLSTVESDPKLESKKRYRDLCHILLPIARKAAESKETYNIVLSLANQMHQQVNELLKCANLEEPSNGASSVQSECEEFEDIDVQDAEAPCERIESIPIDNIHSNTLEKVIMRKRRNEQNESEPMSNIVDKPKKAKRNQKKTGPVQSPTSFDRCFPQQHDPTITTPMQSMQNPNVYTNLCHHQNPNIDQGVSHNISQMLLDSNLYYSNHSKDQEGSHSFPRMVQPTLHTSQLREPQFAKPSLLQEAVKDMHERDLNVGRSHQEHFFPIISLQQDSTSNKKN